MADYWRAEESVTEMARELIDRYHPHLEDARIFFLFREEAATKNGRIVLGKASKVSSKECALIGMEFDFKIELAYDHWVRMDDETRRALLDHELCHCTMNERGDWAIRSHDIEEFAEIVERHGAWMKDVLGFLLRTRQLDLFGESEPEPEMSLVS